MTKEQLELKLSFIPLTQPVEVSYALDGDGIAVLQMHWDSIPGPSTVTLQIPINPNETNLSDICNNLPLATPDRLVSLAIMLAAPLPI